MGQQNIEVVAAMVKECLDGCTGAGLVVAGGRVFVRSGDDCAELAVPLRVEQPAFVSVHERLPEVGVDIIGLNMVSGEMEFGFRSEVDTDPVHWVDFSYPLTHWAYCVVPESCL